VIVKIHRQIRTCLFAIWALVSESFGRGRYESGTEAGQNG